MSGGNGQQRPYSISISQIQRQRLLHLHQQADIAAHAGSISLAQFLIVHIEA